MKIGEIYLIELDYYYIIRILKLEPHPSQAFLAIFDMIDYPITYTICKKETHTIYWLKEFIVKPLKRKDWYKAVRKCNENRRNIFNQIQ